MTDRVDPRVMERTQNFDILLAVNVRQHLPVLGFEFEPQPSEETEEYDPKRGLSFFSN